MENIKSGLQMNELFGGSKKERALKIMVKSG